MLFSASLLSFFIVEALGCAGHGLVGTQLEPLRSANRMISRLWSRQTTLAVVRPDWNYTLSEDWGAIKPEYGLCQNGTQQAPIGLVGTTGSSKDPLTFSYNTTSGGTLSGSWFNTRFYPQFTLNRPNGYGALPTLKFGSETVYLTSFHIHNPSEHTIDGVRARAEIHLVHTNVNGEERAVVGIRVNPGSTNSQWFASLPPYVRFDSDASVAATINLQRLITEAGGIPEYFTYSGSLTSPPCKQGIKWIVAKNVLNIGAGQLQALLGASRYCARAQQPVWQHFS